MKKLSNFTNKACFMEEAGKEYKNNRTFFLIMEDLYSVIQHELGILKDEIRADGTGIMFRDARRHLVKLAIDKGVPLNAIAYHINKLPKCIEDLLIEHENLNTVFRGAYKHDHEEILLFINGKSPGLCRGVPSTIVFSEDDFEKILIEVQIKGLTIKRLLIKFRLLSKKKEGAYEIEMSERQLHDLICSFGIAKDNIPKICQYLLMFAT